MPLIEVPAVVAVAVETIPLPRYASVVLAEPVKVLPLTVTSEEAAMPVPVPVTLKVEPVTVTGAVIVRPVLPVLTVKVSLVMLRVPPTPFIETAFLLLMMEFERVPALVAVIEKTPFLPSMVTLSTTMVAPVKPQAAEP